MKRIQVASAVDAAVEQLRSAILSGEMRPGEAVPVRRLEEQLGISHIPIREALRQLEAEGLVISSPRRAPVIAGVAVEELAALYELRRLVELPTVRLAVERATAADAKRVRAAFARMEHAAPDKASPDFWEAHRELHTALIAAGANAWTQRVLDPLWRATERYVRLFVTRFRSPDEALRMHRVLVETHAQRDADAMEAALAEHFQETERVIREGFESVMAGSPSADDRRLVGRAR